MKLFEVLNNHVIYDWLQGMDVGMETAEFDIGGNKYHVNFLDTKYTVDQVNKHCVDISFILFSEDGEMDDSMTGTGNEFKVMATVLETIDDFLHHNHNVSAISFSAREPSRQRLYKRLVKQFMSKGWKEVDHDDEHKGGAYNWVLTQ